MLNNKILHNQLISRRTFLIGAGKLSLLSLLAGRMFYMQCIKRNEYTTLSNKNRISLILIQPDRGQIYDRHGELLATNKLCFRLFLDKTIAQNYNEELLLIRRILELSESQWEHIKQKVQKTKYQIPAMILDQLTWEQISIIEEYKHKLNSIKIDIGQNRFYPVADVAAHLIGYTGQANAQESREMVGNGRDFNIGKSGIEKYYEETLHGTAGYKQMEINAFGKYVRELASISSTAGQNLTLNIDAELQKKTAPYLNKYGSSAMVMNCRNGEILIYGVSPSFEPNNFVKLSQEYWQSLVSDSYKPLINKIVQNSYPPGSVFKIITILAALEYGISPNKVVYCTGQPALKNGFRCSSKIGHGALDMVGALKYSCNSYMYEIAKLIGADIIIDMARRFGFGELTGIDMPGEVAGFVPSKKWKKNKLKSNWSLGDTLNLSIGQGFLLVTPVQLACFSSAIANHGKLFVPQLAKNKPSYKQINIKHEYIEIVKESMRCAVNEMGGTAYYSRITNDNYMLAGKTGTVQVQAKASANDDLNRTSIAWEKRNHGVFIGFAPYHDPCYSVAVFVDHGGGGGKSAAPIASKIIHEVLEKYKI